MRQGASANAFWKLVQRVGVQEAPMQMAARHGWFRRHTWLSANDLSSVSKKPRSFGTTPSSKARAALK